LRLEKDETGELLRIARSCHQLELGNDKPFFEEEIVKLKKLCKSSWLTNLPEFFCTQKITLHDPTNWVPTLQRANDEFLTDIFVLRLKGRISIDHAQHMRFFLKVTTLSEIVDGSGRYITEDAWAGRASQDNKTKLLYPRQDAPGEKALKYFGDATKPLLAEDENRKMKKLKKPPGEWTRSNSPRLSEWKCYYSPSTRLMYRRSSDWSEHFSQHKEVSERERREGSATMFRHPASTPEKCLCRQTQYRLPRTRH
jgi:hypothetical protein